MSDPTDPDCCPPEAAAAPPAPDPAPAAPVPAPEAAAPPPAPAPEAPPATSTPPQSVAPAAPQQDAPAPAPHQDVTQSAPPSEAPAAPAPHAAAPAPHTDAPSPHAAAPTQDVTRSAPAHDVTQSAPHHDAAPAPSHAAVAPAAHAPEHAVVSLDPAAVCDCADHLRRSAGDLSELGARLTPAPAAPDLGSQLAHLRTQLAALADELSTQASDLDLRGHTAAHDSEPARAPLADAGRLAFGGNTFTATSSAHGPGVMDTWTGGGTVVVGGDTPGVTSHNVSSHDVAAPAHVVSIGGGLPQVQTSGGHQPNVVSIGGGLPEVHTVGGGFPQADPGGQGVTVTLGGDGLGRETPFTADFDRDFQTILGATPRPATGDLSGFYREFFNGLILMGNPTPLTTALP
jgi:hypothetical protein